MRSSVATDAAIRASQQDLLKAGGGGGVAADRLANDFARLQGPSAAGGLAGRQGANAALPYVLANGRVKLR